MNSIGLIEDGAVLIINGIIAAVGPTRRVENLAEARNAIDLNASGHVVMPAFVDPHAHLMGGASLVDRDDNEILERGFMDFDRPRRAAFAAGQIGRTPAKTIEHRTQKLLQLFVRHGSLTIEAKSGYGLSEGAETKLLKIIGRCNGEMTTIIPTFFVPAESYAAAASTRTQYVTWLASDFLPRLTKKRLIRFVDVDCDVDEGGRADVFTIMQAASASQLPLKVHTDGHHTESLEAAIQHHAASIDGLHRVNAESARNVAATPTVATIIPGDAIHGDADAPAPARMLIDAGVAVAVASGFHHYRTTTYNMQSVISLACSQMNMTTAEAISAATINAAHACCIASQTGSLQFGKDADLLILAVSDYREISYYFGVNQVQLAMKRGQTIFHDSAFCP